MLFTIGYEGLDVQCIIKTLKAHDVHILVDVRELPLSRKKGFSKSALSEAVTRAGLQYVHAKELGAPRPVRHALRAGGEWAEYCRGYSQHLDANEAALERVRALAREQNVCLLCYEADYRECHRSLIAARLEETDTSIKVTHVVARTATVAEILPVPA